jgi:transposase
VAILRRHLLDRVPVSDLCEELGLRPTVFYRWQKEFFENGAAAFQAQERPRHQAEEKQKRIEFLEKKAQTKDEVLAELMAEHIALKKSLGDCSPIFESLSLKQRGISISAVGSPMWASTASSRADRGHTGHQVARFGNAGRKCQPTSRDQCKSHWSFRRVVPSLR